MTRLISKRWGVDAETIRHPLPPPFLSAGQRNPRRTNSIFVPTSDQPHKNLSLVGETSRTLQKLGLPHEFRATVAEPEESWSGLPVTAVGRLDQADVVDEYLRADCVFLPSRHESFSYPLAEAAALCVPVAAAEIPVNLETGSVSSFFPPGDPAAAAKAIRIALNDTDARYDRTTSMSPALYLETLLS